MTRRKDNDRLSSELEQRIEELEGTDEATFGTFTRLDWLLLILTCVVIPLIVAFAFR